MITKNGIEARNLTEQVLKNKQDIAEIKESDLFVNGLGITVLGQLDSADDLPETSDNYGDAYAVGESTPYDFYVWTRANIDAGHDEDYWFNIGELAIVGPRGAQGATGPQGVGFKTAALTSLTTAGEYTRNTITLTKTDGTTTTFIVQAKNGVQGVQGPQGLQGIQGLIGPQGPKGDTGDVGGFINIAGIIASSAALPSPSSLKDLTKAYLVGASEPYDLWIQVGETSATAIWQNMGVLNVATYVTVNGQYQNTWSADTKLDANKTAVSNVGGLVIPSTTPTTKEIVGVDTNNQQIRIKLGGNLSWSGNMISCNTPDYYMRTFSVANGGWYDVQCSFTTIMTTYDSFGGGSDIDSFCSYYWNSGFNDGNDLIFAASGTYGMSTNDLHPVTAIKFHKNWSEDTIEVSVKYVIANGESSTSWYQLTNPYFEMQANAIYIN